MAINSVSAAPAQQAVPHQANPPSQDSDGDNDGSKPGSVDTRQPAPASSVSTTGSIIDTKA